MGRGQPNIIHPIFCLVLNILRCMCFNRCENDVSILMIFLEPSKCTFRRHFGHELTFRQLNIQIHVHGKMPNPMNTAAKAKIESKIKFSNGHFSNHFFCGVPTISCHGIVGWVSRLFA